MAGIEPGSELSAEVVRTKQLHIVDNEGNVRAFISAGTEGHVGIVLRDETGKDRAAFVHTIGQKSALQFTAADGTPRVSIVAQDNGLCAISLFGQEGRALGSLNTDPASNVRLNLHDKSGKPRLLLSVSPDGAAHILLNGAGSKNAVLEVPTDGDPSFVLLDEKGKIIGSLP